MAIPSSQMPIKVVVYNSPNEHQPLTTTSISALNRIRVRQQKNQRLNTAAIAHLKHEPQW